MNIVERDLEHSRFQGFLSSQMSGPFDQLVVAADFRLRPELRLLVCPPTASPAVLGFLQAGGWASRTSFRGEGEGGREGKRGKRRLR